MSSSRKTQIFFGNKEVKNILVTGAAGLLGANFTRHLLSQGYSVVGVDDLSGGYMEFLPVHANFEFLHAKSSDPKVIKLIESGDVSYIYHFAAMPAAGLSPFIRTFNYENNTIESSRLINAAINGNVKKFIFTSSMEVYGDNPKTPFKESDILECIPETPYGIAKRMIELDLESAWNYHGLDYAIVRPHNVHGIYQNIWDGYRNVIGIFIRQALAGQQLTVYGDGEQKRAYSDIAYYMEPLEKLMMVHSRANRYPTSLPVWNIGSDTPHTINELVEAIRSTCRDKGIKVPEVTYHEARKEVKDAWCDHSLAKQELDFKDDTNLYTLISNMIDWARFQPNREVKKVDFEVTSRIYSYWKTENK